MTETKESIYIHYCLADNPYCNLYNKKNCIKHPLGRITENEQKKINAVLYWHLEENLVGLKYYFDKLFIQA